MRRFRAASGELRDRCGPGFTLLELLAVLAIVALLASIAIGGGRRASESGKMAQARAELAALSVALESYRQLHGDFPRTTNAAELLQALIGRRDPAGAACRSRTCLELAAFTVMNEADPLADVSAVIVDPWDQPYRYAYASPTAGWTRSDFVLYSCGPDRADVPLPANGWPDETAAANRDNLHAE